MDKNTFKQEIKDYTARGGKFAFAFEDLRKIQSKRKVQWQGSQSAYL